MYLWGFRPVSLEGGFGTSISETITYELKYVPEPGPTIALAAGIACLMILDARVYVKQRLGALEGVPNPRVGSNPRP